MIICFFCYNHARERIGYLKDADSDFLEIGAFVGEGMYEEYGGCPSGGVVAGITYVKKRQCIVVANDATVKAGAWFPITGKKNLRLQEISMENECLLYTEEVGGSSPSSPTKKNPLLSGFYF